MSTVNKKTIDLPRASVERLLDATRFVETAQDEIEDYLISRNEALSAKIRKARSEHIAGNYKDFKNLLRGHV